MAKANYSYEKRARELEKQKKKEDKRLKKLAEKNGTTIAEERAAAEQKAKDK